MMALGCRGGRVPVMRFSEDDPVIQMTIPVALFDMCVSSVWNRIFPQAERAVGRA
ncbi:hypothetical protein LY76DRAFT_592303 [Colletotrichum caudatum]|nr:hypothetical protein LY76DRAFT_592303 [Colletotrichum caudatum]